MAENKEPDEPEDMDQAEDQEPDEPEDAGQAELVDLSRFYASALKPLHGYFQSQNAWISKMIADSPALRMRPVLPRIVVDSSLIRMTAFTENLGRQMADLTGFNDMVRKALEPLAATYRPPQWHSVFASLGDVIDRLYPENLREVRPDLDDLEELLVEEGIPLMWVPRPQTVRALLDAPDAAARRRIIGRRWTGIVNDCEAVLEEVTHPDVQDARDFALDVVHALRAGHTSAAQALAANLLDSLLQRHFDKDFRIELTKNDFKTTGVKFKFEDHKFKVACTFAPVWYAHAKYHAKNGDPIPRTFGRHPSAHGVSRTQYSRINTVYALMLVTSVIKFFDTELP
ncbi:hypothetical protein [Streptomyces sp. NBC_00576]|uniref:hypothetical protein n=1 Tax=Streptomyces sp. NBC_00576 TaxID=2903665 RepID=UPI002E8192D2|nr:hypothetical protein [Streptomyces sp. NBC_00576]WUB68628.1 hypothetical protein OG734_00045 [Streptomyces sp. NBC_00576]WUB77069.1 hypothetical protein OG734_47505 [Streptomyces sp. NBC_00576]